MKYFFIIYKNTEKIESLGIILIMQISKWGEGRREDELNYKFKYSFHTLHIMIRSFSMFIHQETVTLPP